MVYSLGDRQKTYEQAYDSRIIRRLPVIVRVDGRSFHKVTKKLSRPYSASMVNLMANTMFLVAKEMDGCVFAYQQSDEITFVLRNDQSLESEPWFNNRVQKIASISAAMTTSTFIKLHQSMDDPPQLIGNTLFDARVFAVPSINEAINNLIFRQQDCIRNAITGAAQAELGKIFGRKKTFKTLQNKNAQERMQLLLDECDIDFNSYYPAAFRHGVAAYKIPQLIDTDEGQVTRHKWVMDTQLPKFVENRAFIMGILNTGRDIFRLRDLDEDTRIG